MPYLEFWRSRKIRLGLAAGLWGLMRELTGGGSTRRQQRYGKGDLRKASRKYAQGSNGGIHPLTYSCFDLVVAQWE